jgi:primosomal protein N''
MSSTAARNPQAGAGAIARLARRRAERQAYVAKIREGLQDGKTMEQLGQGLGLVEETPGLLQQRLAEARRRAPGAHRGSRRSVRG